MPTNNLPPVQLPAPTATPSAPPPAQASAITLGAASRTIAGHPVTTHTVIAALTALLLILGPLIVARWPQAAPIIAEVQKALPKLDQATQQPQQPTPYAIGIAAALDIEDESNPKLRVKRLAYLYRGTLANAAATKDLAELKASFDAEEKRLDMTGKLPLTRAVIAAEWTRQIPEKAPATITDATRARIVAFLRQTLTILEALP